MAYELKTRPTDESVLEFLRSAEPARTRTQGLLLLDIFTAETGAEPRMWGPSIVGFGHVGYIYPTGHSGEMCRVGFRPLKAALTLCVASPPRADQQPTGRDRGHRDQPLTPGPARVCRVLR